jgi:hypothetical protein
MTFLLADALPGRRIRDPCPIALDYLTMAETDYYYLVRFILQPGLS